MTTLDLGNKKLDVGDGVTVVKIGGKARDDAAARLAKALPVVRAGDVPRPPERPAPAASDDVSAEADVAKAETALADAKAALEKAEIAYRAAQDTLLDARRSIDDEAAGALSAAEARLEVAQAGAAAARRTLDQARDAADRSRADERSRRGEAEQQAAAWRDEQAELERRKADVASRLAELGPSPEAGPVEEALAGLRRLRQVKPKPSSKGLELAGRWAEARERLAALPAPPSPPEWLVTPALQALTEAREALAEAEASSTPADVDPVKVQAVEAAHHEVLEAEQRVMRKGNRQNKRRLDTAHEAERAALTAVGVASYGEYLQRVVPGERLGSEERIKHARAALADAEAVWEELHGGQASAEYTAAREHQQAVRAEALAMLGREVSDEDLEDALRSHLEAVVDTGWAEQALADALAAVGVTVGEGGDVEAAADAWLAEVPARREQYRAVEGEQRSIAQRLSELERLLSEAEASGAAAAEASDTGGATQSFDELQQALDEAEAAEQEAKVAAEQAQQRVEASTKGTARAGELETAADAARGALDKARARVEEAERALGDARKVAAASAAAPKPAPQGGPPSGPSSVEADVWLLARLASTEAAAFVIDARAVAGKRSLRLLEKAAAARPIVVLGDEGEVTAWAAGLGDRATVRTV